MIRELKAEVEDLKAQLRKKEKDDKLGDENMAICA